MNDTDITFTPTERKSGDNWEAAVGTEPSAGTAQWIAVNGASFDKDGDTYEKQ